jgi:hypothetical protein
MKRKRELRRAIIGEMDRRISKNVVMVTTSELRDKTRAHSIV